MMSSCCSARVFSPDGDWAICLDCKEYCDAVDENDEIDAQFGPTESQIDPKKLKHGKD